MLKIWGRNTSSNVQKAMFAVGELGLAYERIDVGGAFGKNREAPYLAMNPNGLVPTLEEDGDPAVDTIPSSATSPASSAPANSSPPIRGRAPRRANGWTGSSR